MTFEIAIIALLVLFGAGSILHSVIATRMIDKANKQKNYFFAKAEKFATKNRLLKQENRLLKSEVAQLELITQMDLPEVFEAV